MKSNLFCLPVLRFSPGLMLIIILLSLAELSVPSIAAEPDYKPITTGHCNFRFPQDHAAHPGYRTEWWYYTGNLQSENGKRFGFQLTFFRRQTSPIPTEQQGIESPSAWRTNQIFLAHAALSDIENKEHFHDERMAREALGMAGAREEAGQIIVNLKNWSTTIDTKEHRLVAATPDFSLDLLLKVQKPPVAHGDSGYSLKGREPQSASCYYSLTRLEATGSLTVNNSPFKVRGPAWMDHELSSAPLEPDMVGWDWFSLQLDNGTELMLYLLRQNEGSYSPASSGTFVGRSGEAIHLVEGSFTIEVLDHWRSPHSRAVYPARWRIVVPQLSLDLTVDPSFADQEMQTPRTTDVTYWEGSVSARGSASGNEVAGTGYVELTGYEKKFDAPM